MRLVFLGLMGLVFALFGGYALVSPIELTGNLGVEVSGRHGAFEMRGIYGGVSLGAALLCFAGTIWQGMQRPALYFLLAYTGGYLIARGVAFALDGPPEPVFYSFIGFEAVVALCSALLLRGAPR